MPSACCSPSLTIRGLQSGNVGQLARNVIAATAIATLGIRLVKGNDPAAMLDLVEAHVRAQGYHIVRTDPDHDTRKRVAHETAAAAELVAARSRKESRRSCLRWARMIPPPSCVRSQ